MTERIQVAPGYTVAPKYIELEEGERLCPECHGEGKVVHVYGQFNNTKGACWTCHGLGKIAFCGLCHEQRHIIKHDSRVAWMDDLCLDCIRRQIASESET